MTVNDEYAALILAELQKTSGDLTACHDTMKDFKAKESNATLARAAVRSDSLLADMQEARRLVQECITTADRIIATVDRIIATVDASIAAVDARNNQLAKTRNTYRTPSADIEPWVPGGMVHPIDSMQLRGRAAYVWDRVTGELVLASHSSYYMQLYE